MNGHLSKLSTTESARNWEPNGYQNDDPYLPNFILTSLNRILRKKVPARLIIQNMIPIRYFYSYKPNGMIQ